jgi:hypothetical protein
MNTARSSQRLHARPTRTTESFFNTTPHPSQKLYSNKNGTGDSKANKDVANFVDFDIINKFQIGVDTSHTVITGNMFTLQHGSFAPDGSFPLELLSMDIKHAKVSTRSGRQLLRQNVRGMMPLPAMMVNPQTPKNSYVSKMVMELSKVSSSLAANFMTN